MTFLYVKKLNYISGDLYSARVTLKVGKLLLRLVGGFQENICDIYILGGGGR